MGNHEKMFGICENKCLVETIPKTEFDEKVLELNNEINTVESDLSSQITNVKSDIDSIRANNYSIVKYDGYQYPVPVMAGDQYSTDGGKNWTTVQNNGQLTSPFSGIVRYYGVCTGTMPITNSELLSGSADNLIGQGIREAEKSFVVGSKGYVYNPNNYSINHLDVYDINGNRTSGNKIPNIIVSFSIFILGEKAYLCGGFNYSSDGEDVYSCAEVYVYDVNGNITQGTSLSQKRQQSYAFTVGNRGYVCGGYYFPSSSSKYSPSKTYKVDIYDVNGNRTVGTNLSTSNWGYNADTFNLGNKAYIIIGYNGSTRVNTVIVCDANGVFSTGTPLSSARSSVACFVLGNKAYVCGGNHGGSVTNVVDVYDVNGNRTTGTSLSESKRNATAFSLLDSFGLVCSGYRSYMGNVVESYYSTKVDVYDVNGNKSSGPEMTKGREDPKSFVIDNIKGFVYGGRQYKYDDNDEFSTLVQTFYNKLTSVFPLTMYSEYLINGEADMATSHTTKTIISNTGVLDRTYKIKYQNGIITNEGVN